MNKIALALVFGFVGIASVGIAAGLYVASQGGDADNERQVVETQETPTPKPALTEGPGPTATQEAEPYVTEPDAIPTVEPFVPPTPTPLALRWPNPFPTAEEVEIDPDGKYVIRHRADGCDYSEDQRTVRPEDGRLWVLLRSPECALVGLLIPGRQSALEVVPIPTVATPATPEPPTPTPTPEFGVCPTPVRQTPEDFEQPPPVRPASEIFGQRVQGGESYTAGYLTVHLPAGREFAVLSHWDRWDGQYMEVIDIETQSALTLRGDGCESYRFTREAAADGAFDEIVSTLEVSSTYVCLPPYRKMLRPEEARVDPSGPVVRGGEPSEGWGSGLHLPAGRDFAVWRVLRDPGGGFTAIYDVATRSVLILGEDGCEEGREITDPVADSVFDEIVGAMQIPTVQSPPGP